MLKCDGCLDRLEKGLAPPSASNPARSGRSNSDRSTLFARSTDRRPWRRFLPSRRRSPLSPSTRRKTPVPSATIRARCSFIDRAGVRPRIRPDADRPLRKPASSAGFVLTALPPSLRILPAGRIRFVTVSRVKQRVNTYSLTLDSSRLQYLHKKK